MNNYPDGVTGNERELAGDTEYAYFCECVDGITDRDYSKEESLKAYKEGLTPYQFAEILEGTKCAKS